MTNSGSGPICPEVTVIGVGSPLRGDDAVGLLVAERLQHDRELPPQIEVLEAGLCGVDLVLLLERAPHAIIVDAAEFGGTPGELRLFGWEQIRQSPPRPLCSAHEVDVLQALNLAAALGLEPDVLFVAIQAEQTAVGAAPSRALGGRIRQYAEAVKEQALKLARAPCCEGAAAGCPGGRNAALRQAQGRLRGHPERSRGAQREGQQDGQDPGC